MRLTRHNSKAPANAQDPGLVTIAQLTVVGADPADVAAFTAESRLRHIEYTRSEGLYCHTCAAAQFDLNADRETCRACLQPTRPGLALVRRDAFAVIAGLESLPLELLNLAEVNHHSLVVNARHFFYTLPQIHDALKRSRAWAYLPRGQVMVAAAASELRRYCELANPDRPYIIRDAANQ